MIDTLIIILYYRNEAIFLDFCLFLPGFKFMTVWNTIDDRYSNYYPLYRNEAIFLDFCLFLPGFKFMTVWNTIDDRYSNFVFFIERKPQSLISTSF